MADLIYANIDRIAKRLSGRITVVDVFDYGLTGITGTQIGTDLLYIIGAGIEDFVNMYLGMIYILPLANNHPYLNSIVEKLIVSEIYLSYFPTQGESGQPSDSFPSLMRQQALNEFQVLFDGLGIFVPGATNNESQIQNDENKQQESVRTIILPGEQLKTSIGYDLNGDNVSDTDLYKLNTNVQPSFYMSGNLNHLEEGDAGVVNGVRTRAKRTYYNPNKVEIDFW